MGVNSLPKTVTGQRRGCDFLNPGPTAPESSTLITRLPSHPVTGGITIPPDFFSVDFWFHTAGYRFVAVGGFRKLPLCPDRE